MTSVMRDNGNTVNVRLSHRSEVEFFLCKLSCKNKVSGGPAGSGKNMLKLKAQT
jgi:hypothetical protein